jgi:hypothetical protein
VRTLEFAHAADQEAREKTLASKVGWTDRLYRQIHFSTCDQRSRAAKMHMVKTMRSSLRMDTVGTGGASKLVLAELAKKMVARATE